eukprot:scaffold3291_cov109-Isochrysis_galbana.AAC.2
MGAPPPVLALPYVPCSCLRSPGLGAWCAGLQHVAHVAMMCVFVCVRARVRAHAHGKYIRRVHVHTALTLCSVSKKNSRYIRIARALNPHSLSLTRLRLLYSHSPQTPLPTNPFGKVSWGGMPQTLQFPNV